MNADPDQIQRLGFEAWADNLIVDTLEGMAEVANMSAPCEFDAEDDDWSISIRSDGKEATAFVRAYVKGEGWKTTDRLITMKGGRK